MLYMASPGESDSDSSIVNTPNTLGRRAMLRGSAKAAVAAVAGAGVGFVAGNAMRKEYDKPEIEFGVEDNVADINKGFDTIFGQLKQAGFGNRVLNRAGKVVEVSYGFKTPERTNYLLFKTGAEKTILVQNPDVNTRYVILSDRVLKWELKLPQITINPTLPPITPTPTMSPTPSPSREGTPTIQPTIPPTPEVQPTLAPTPTIQPTVPPTPTRAETFPSNDYAQLTTFGVNNLTEILEEAFNRRLTK